jgi:hypothetical protein
MVNISDYAGEVVGGDWAPALQRHTMGDLLNDPASKSIHSR